MSNRDFENELNPVDYDALSRAGDAVSWKNNAGVDRYVFYRRKGHRPADALEYALAWCKNATEQAKRRKDHLTGCV